MVSILLYLTQWWSRNLCQSSELVLQSEDQHSKAVLGLADLADDLQFQGGLVARNSTPTTLLVWFWVLGLLTKLAAAMPPGLVAPSAYFWCSVTQALCAFAPFLSKVVLQSKQVRRDAEQWLKCA